MKSKIRKQILEMCDTLRESLSYVKAAKADQAFKMLCDGYQVVEAIEGSMQKEFESPLNEEYVKFCHDIKDAMEEINEAVQTGVSPKNAISHVRNGLRLLAEKLTKETQIQKTGKAIIFMCIYNTPAAYLRDAVKSVLNQSEPDLLLLILDHGSTDGTTAKTLKQFAAEDERIILFRCEKNMKLTPQDDPETFAAWEHLWDRLLEESGAEYFATLDSDDKYDRDFLKKMIAAAQINHADLAICGTTVINEDNVVGGTDIPPKLLVDNCCMKAEEFMLLYKTLRILWGKLYSMRYWKRFFTLYMNALGKNGGDTLLVLNLMCEIGCLLSEPKSLHVYRARKHSMYHQWPSPERIGEGVQIYNAGVMCAKHYNLFSPQIELFLKNVFRNHISVLLEIINSQAKEKPSETVQFIRRILDNSLYQSLCIHDLIQLQQPMLIIYSLLPIMDHGEICCILNNSENENSLLEIEKVKKGFEEGNDDEALTIDTTLLMEMPLDESLLLYRLKIENRISYRQGEAVYACIAETLFPDNEDIRKEAQIMKKKEIILQRNGIA